MLVSQIWSRARPWLVLAWAAPKAAWVRWTLGVGTCQKMAIPRGLGLVLLGSPHLFLPALPPHTYCLGLFQNFLLVIWYCSERPQQRVLFSCPLCQVVLRVGSQLGPLLCCPHTIPFLVSSNCSCWLVGPAQIGPNKESYFLVPWVKLSPE